jgi:hypothetical protein
MGMGDFHGMPMPGYGIPYGGYQPLYGMGGYMGRRPGLVPPGMPNTLSYRYGMGGMPGMFGRDVGMLGYPIAGASNAQELRNQYDTQVQQLHDYASRTSMPPAQAMKLKNELDRQTNARLRNMQQLQQYFGPQSGHGQFYGRPPFEAAGAMSYSGGFDGNYPGGESGNTVPATLDNRYWNRAQQEHDRESALRDAQLRANRGPGIARAAR